MLKLIICFVIANIGKNRVTLSIIQKSCVFFCSIVKCMNILIIKPQHETIKYFQPTKMATLVAPVVARPRSRH